MTKPTKWPLRPGDQPGLPPSLISLRCPHEKPWILRYPVSAQQRLLSDWADAKADHSLRWDQRLFCWFCHEVAHLKKLKVDNNLSMISHFQRECENKDF